MNEKEIDLVFDDEDNNFITSAQIESDETNDMVDGDD